MRSPKKPACTRNGKQRTAPLLTIRRDFVTGLAAVMLLGACDPWYTVGARVRLGPPAPDSCVLASLRQSFGRAPLEGISLRPGSYNSIRMPIDSTLESSDSVAGSLQGNSKLLIEPQKDSALLVELSTGWMGTAATVPTATQRRYVAAATSRLQEVRATCAPKSSREVECVAGGWGRHPACSAGT